jgi:hypothetical protein
MEKNPLTGIDTRKKTLHSSQAATGESKISGVNIGRKSKI